MLTLPCLTVTPGLDVVVKGVCSFSTTTRGSLPLSWLLLPLRMPSGLFSYVEIMVFFFKKNLLFWGKEVKSSYELT